MCVCVQEQRTSTINSRLHKNERVVKVIEQLLASARGQVGRGKRRDLALRVHARAHAGQRLQTSPPVGRWVKEVGEKEEREG